MTTTHALIFILHLATVTTATTSDHYLLSCGTTSAVADTSSTYDSRTWHSDDNSTFSSDFSSTLTATSTTLTNVPKIPFSTARIFTRNFTYSFPVSPGPKFIRLFFHPSDYPPYSHTFSFLTVRSNSGHLLLNNFSASLSTNYSTMFKEFYVHVSSSLLQLTFSPTPPSSHAFLNGIEIVPVPENLYVGPHPPKLSAYPKIEFELTNSVALETVYRVNVGGSEVGSNEDAGRMFRRWENDDHYLTGGFYGITGINDRVAIKYTAMTPNYSAPEEVYYTFRSMGIDLSNKVKMKLNMTWGFEVDLGFWYLLRLHWCEVVVDVVATHYRVFDVYFNEMMVEEGVDIFELVGADTAVHRDYVVYTDAGSDSDSRGVLQLAMHPKYQDILLNGLEIFKLNKSNGRLDAPNPNHPPLIHSPPVQQPPSTSSKSSSHFVSAIICGAVGTTVFLTAVVLYYIFMIRRRLNWFKVSALPEKSNSKSKLFTFWTSTARSSPSATPLSSAQDHTP